MPDTLTSIDGLLEASLPASRPLRIVQVGANDGVTNDPITAFLSSSDILAALAPRREAGED